MKDNKTNTMDLEQLLSELKKKDARNVKISKSFKQVYTVLVILYVIIIVMDLFRQDVNSLIRNILILTASILFLKFFSSQHKKNKLVDYSVSTIQMLKSASSRFKPFKADTLWIYLAMLLISASQYMISPFGAYVFVAFWLIAMIIGYIIWYVKYKPIRDNALNLIAEIEGK